MGAAGKDGDEVGDVFNHNATAGIGPATAVIVVYANIDRREMVFLLQEVFIKEEGIAAARPPARVATIDDDSVVVGTF